MKTTVWPEERVAALVKRCAEVGLVAACAEIGASENAGRSALRKAGISATMFPKSPAAPFPAMETPPRTLGGEEETEALRARIAELEEALATSGPTLDEEGDAAPGKDSLIQFLFDAHVPEQDPAALSAALKWTREHQPDEIILSEPAEWNSTSQHGGNWGARWDKDKADVRRFLISLRSVAPRAKITWQQSNHDTRLERLLEQCLPSFMGSITIPRELGLDDLGIEWVNERTILRRGKIKGLHGHQLATNERSGMLPKYHTARAVQLYGEPGAIVVYGHVHRYQSWSEPCDGGLKQARSIGCLCRLRPAWHRGRESGWHHQFAAAEVAAGGSTNLYAIDITNGAFSFGRRRYAA